MSTTTTTTTTTNGKPKRHRKRNGGGKRKNTGGRNTSSSSSSNSSSSANGGKDEDVKTEIGPIICPGHSRPVPDLCFSKVVEDGRVFLLSSCLDGKPMLRDGETGDWIGTFLGHNGAVWSSRFNDDATRVVTAAADYTAKLWDAVTGDEVASMTHNHIVKAAFFALGEGDNKIVTGGHDKTLRLWDVEAASSVFGNEEDSEDKKSKAVQLTESTIIRQFEKPVTHAMSTQPNLVIAAVNNELQVVDMRSGEVAMTLSTDKAAVTSMSLSARGETLVVSAGAKVYLFNAETLAVESAMDLDKRPIQCAAYDREHGLLYTGSSAELWVRVYDTTGANLDMKKGHHGPVRTIAVHPSLKQYASGSEDGTIRLWDC